MVRNVAVFFGGKSAEREISVLTGVLALKTIDPALFRAVPVYIHSDGDFYTSPEMFSLDVFKEQPLFSKRRIVDGSTEKTSGEIARENFRRAELLPRRRGRKRRNRRAVRVV